MKDETYIFRIDVFTPETLPMARLAEYMAELASLLGNTDGVHFKKLKKGSAQLVSSVEAVAAPKVRHRLQQAEGGHASNEVRKHFDNIDRLLALDNAVGTIKREGPFDKQSALVLRFPGRERVRPPRLGPFNQTTELQGQLVRIGGLDESAHAQFQGVEGKVWKVTLTRLQAKELAGMLYGATLRLTGPGRWVRHDDGNWELLEMRLKDWQPISDQSLREGIAELRTIEGSEWRSDQDAVGLLNRIRHGDDEVH